MHDNYDLDRLMELVQERKFRALREILTEMNEVDIAEFLDELDVEQEILVFRLLPKDLAAEVFSYLEEDQEKLIGALSDRELREVLDELYLDDTVDLIEDLPANLVSRILRNTDASTRSQINRLLNYPKDSAGSLMTTEFVYLHPNNTVEESFARIRKVGLDKETVYTCYVTKSRVLLGVVTVKRLLMSTYETRISDIMETNVLSVTTHEDKEDVAQMFSKYDLTALPVVDGEDRLVGIITVDDAMDVMEEEATEDIEKMAAILPTDKPYFQTGVIETWKHRIPWLLLLMISATFTGTILGFFEEALAANAALLPHADGYRRQLRRTGVGHHYPRHVPGGRRVCRLAAGDLEGAAGVGAVRPHSGDGGVRQGDGGGPEGCHRGRSGGSDHLFYHRYRQAYRLYPAHAGQAAGLRPGGDGLPLYYHCGGCPVPAGLLRHRNTDFGIVTSEIELARGFICDMRRNPPLHCHTANV